MQFFFAQMRSFSSTLEMIDIYAQFIHISAQTNYFKVYKISFSDLFTDVDYSLRTLKLIKYLVCEL